MIICPNCDKHNEDRHKFCLGCGARLPTGAPEAGAPRGTKPGNMSAVSESWAPPPPGLAGASVPPPPPSGVRTGPSPTGRPTAPPPPPPPGGRTPEGAPPPPPPSPADSSRPTPDADAGLPDGYAACPSCGFGNPPGFAFCGRCGTNLVEVPVAAPPASDPAQAKTVFAADAPEPLEPKRAEAVQTGLTDPGQAPRPTAKRSDAPPTSGSGPSAKLIMLGPDGSPIGERVLVGGETLLIGRTEGPPWDEDAYLDCRHGSLTPLADGVRTEDLGSLNGIYVKLHGRVEIQNGDQFRVGQELLRYEDLPEPTPTEDGTERMGSPNPGYWGRLSLMVEPDVSSQAYPIEGDGITIGRESGDITFPHDGYVSGSHCHIIGDDTGVYVEDLGSSNGTYMRVRSGAVLPYGSLVLIGQKLFQLERV